MSNDKAIITKQAELISNLTMQLVTPIPTTHLADRKWKEMEEIEIKLRAELSTLQSEGEGEEEKKEELCDCSDGGEYLDGAYDTHCDRCKKHLR
jgi:hypothetical protein